MIISIDVSVVPETENTVPVLVQSTVNQVFIVILIVLFSGNYPISCRAVWLGWRSADRSHTSREVIAILFLNSGREARDVSGRNAQTGVLT